MMLKPPNIERAEVLRDMERAEQRVDCEMAAARIERVRDELDKVINGLPAFETHMALLRIDKMLQRLKSDLGFPKAGLV